jgi:hypothetical protein
MSHKNLFAHIYDAFGYSPGGYIKDRVFYLDAQYVGDPSIVDRLNTEKFEYTDKGGDTKVPIDRIAVLSHEDYEKSLEMK